MATPDFAPQPKQTIIPALLRHGLAVALGFTWLLTAAAGVTYLPPSQRLLAAATPVEGLRTADRVAAVKKIFSFYATRDERLLVGYTPDERAHLAEVAGVFKIGWRVYYGLLLVTLAGLAFVARRYGYRAFHGQLRYACGVSAVGSLLTLLVGWLGFDRFFERFHRLVFSAAPWTFDPAVSRLVNEFPPEYFWAATALILFATALTAGFGWLLLAPGNKKPSG